MTVLDPTPQNRYLHVRTAAGEEGWVYAPNVTVTKGPAAPSPAAPAPPGAATFGHCADGTALPFAAIEQHHPIDDACGASGKATSPNNSKLQNAAKNNFCAPNGAPETFTPQMLIDLQGNTHVPAGQGKEPSDRSALRNLGEGKRVRMKAFLIEAHHADLGAGESVNCNDPSEEGNDIHMAFGAEAATQECNSVTAEISPHFRPASWNEIGHFQTFENGQTKINGPLAARLQAQPYRITGQLFFDASHAPCPCGTNCHPARSTDWEIHPVYMVEVCKAGTSCDVADDGQWVPFDTWWASPPPGH